MSVSSVYISSTTVHVSVPCVGLAPLRCSSQVNTPLATPWCFISFAQPNLKPPCSLKPDLNRLITPGVLRPIATFTPCER